MEPLGQVLGPASTNFNDYLGTVAAEDAEAVLHEPSLYELADLDRDRYTILAFDPRVQGRTPATLYATDRVEHPDALSGIATRNQNQGDVPVVPFDLLEASAGEFIRRAFSRISVRVVTQPLHDHALVVTGPSQPRIQRLNQEFVDPFGHRITARRLDVRRLRKAETRTACGPG
jgi:hypothetical protein